MKNIWTVIIFIFLGTSSHAQSKFSIPFSSAYDEDAGVLLGIQYSLGLSNYLLDLEKHWHQMSMNYGDGNINNLYRLKSITSTPSLTFSVGIPVDVRITDNLYTTFNPSFTFINNSQVTFTGEDPDREPPERKEINKRTRHTANMSEGTNFNSFDFPLAIKFRSDQKYLRNKFNRYRAYMLAGAKYTRWLDINQEYKEIQNTNSTKPEPLIMKPGFYSWEAGVGLDIFFTYFKMSPELKFSQSFGSVFDSNSPLLQTNQYMPPLHKAYLRNVYLTIIFQ